LYRDLSPVSSFQMVADSADKVRKDVARMNVDEQCLLRLCDPDAFSTQEAGRIARALARIEPGLDLELAHSIELRSADPELDLRIIERGLVILNTISNRNRLRRIYTSFSTSRNSFLRSRSSRYVSQQLRNSEADFPRKLKG
jgi:hypothetical protein